MLLRDKVAKHERFRVILYTLLSICCRDGALLVRLLYPALAAGERAVPDYCAYSSLLSDAFYSLITLTTPHHRRSVATPPSHTTYLPTSTISLAYRAQSLWPVVSCTGSSGRPL